MTEENKPKRIRRTKAEMQVEDEVLKGLSTKEESYKPVKRKKEAKKVVKAKDKSNYVPANFDPSYMIPEVSRKDCYVYAVKKVKFDKVTQQQKEGKEFLLTFRVGQVHETAIWEDDEMKTNTIHQGLLSEYGVANVKLVNDPYEYE